MIYYMCSITWRYFKFVQCSRNTFMKHSKKFSNLVHSTDVTGKQYTIFKRVEIATRVRVFTIGN